jgi:hypothetical protein
MRAMVAILLHGLLMACAPGTGAGTDAGSAQTGVYRIAFHPQAGALLPPGATFVCRVRIMPGINAAQSTTGAAAGNKSGCATELPFVWMANHSQPAATLSYEVDTISADGRVLRSVIREDVALPNASAGAAARIDVAF